MTDKHSAQPVTLKLRREDIDAILALPAPAPSFRIERRVQSSLLKKLATVQREPSPGDVSFTRSELYVLWAMCSSRATQEMQNQNRKPAKHWRKIADEVRAAGFL